MSMKEKNFNPQTMQLATTSDIFRMWKRLWGGLVEDGEHLDKVQLHSSVEQKLPRQSHNLEIASANLAAATNENRISDVRIAEVKHALGIQMVGDETVSQEQPANRAGVVKRADAMPDARNEESAASSTEPSEVN